MFHFLETSSLSPAFLPAVAEVPVCDGSLPVQDYSVPEFLHFTSLGVYPEAIVPVLAHPEGPSLSSTPPVATLLFLNL